MMDAAKAKKRVLLAEDNLDSAEIMTVLLEGGGYEVRAANDGLLAVEAARQFKPDVAIIDIGLPGISGYEVACRLRDSMPNVVLIALTGWRIEPGDTRVRDAGFRHYLNKPFDPAELNRLLNAL